MNGSSYQRFVKTTPKPSATKKSKGELGPPPPPEFVGEGEAEAVVEDVPSAEEVVADMMDMDMSLLFLAMMIL